MEIIKMEELTSTIYAMTLKGSLVQEMKEPGQFVHIKVDEQTPLLRRPISLANIEKERSEFTVIFRKEGVGTSELSKKRVGESLDILGPLGNGFPLTGMHEGKTALLIGGGVGIPPLYELSKQLNKRGVNVFHVLGFQSKEQMFFIDEFTKLGPTFVSTADGSKGTKGFVTDILDQEQLNGDRIYSCGPTPMLKALEDRFKDQDFYVSLEERMACGIGACFACVRKVKKQECGHDYKKICSDGPVFHIGEVIL
jgi:dihydroorotate dehydrogenase electron transfer subunit